MDVDGVKLFNRLQSHWYATQVVIYATDEANKYITAALMNYVTLCFVSLTPHACDLLAASKHLSCTFTRDE